MIRKSDARWDGEIVCSRYEMASPERTHTSDDLFRNQRSSRQVWLESMGNIT